LLAKKTAQFKSGHCPVQIEGPVRQGLQGVRLTKVDRLPQRIAATARTTRRGLRHTTRPSDRPRPATIRIPHDQSQQELWPFSLGFVLYTTQEPDLAEAVEQVAALEKTFHGYFLTEDVNPAIDLYADDARVLIANMEWTMGKERIRDLVLGSRKQVVLASIQRDALATGGDGRRSTWPTGSTGSSSSPPRTPRCTMCTGRGSTSGGSAPMGSGNCLSTSTTRTRSRAEKTDTDLWDAGNALPTVHLHHTFVAGLPS
jgi:hypothetical protein